METLRVNTKLFNDNVFVFLPAYARVDLYAVHAQDLQFMGSHVLGLIPQFFFYIGL